VAIAQAGAGASVKDIIYPFESMPVLWKLIGEADEGKDLPLPRSTCAVCDGEWVVLRFEVGERSLALAARILESDDGLRAILEDRDWDRLLKFSEAHPESSQRQTVEQSPQRTAEQSPQRTESDILVVDDDGETLQVTEALLLKAGYPVSLVASAEAAFDRLREHGARLILLDCELPGMSGPEFCRRLRKDRAWARVPVLLMSARIESDLSCDVTSALADDFIVKPFRAPELIARMQSLLSTRTLGS
jgi:two-component system phosphate regulon response regulator PhoB